jgi:hypothetical protein
MVVTRRPRVLSMQDKYDFADQKWRVPMYEAFRLSHGAFVYSTKSSGVHD